MHSFIMISFFFFLFSSMLILLLYFKELWHGANFVSEKEHSGTRGQRRSRRGLAYVDAYRLQNGPGVRAEG